MLEAQLGLSAGVGAAQNVVYAVAQTKAPGRYLPPTPWPAEQATAYVSSGAATLGRAMLQVRAERRAWAQLSRRVWTRTAMRSQSGLPRLSSAAGWPGPLHMGRWHEQPAAHGQLCRRAPPAGHHAGPGQARRRGAAGEEPGGDVGGGVPGGVPCARPASNLGRAVAAAGRRRACLRLLLRGVTGSRPRGSVGASTFLSVRGAGEQWPWVRRWQLLLLFLLQLPMTKGSRASPDRGAASPTLPTPGRPCDACSTSWTTQGP